MASISVVMACYNEEKNISRAIESILNQTFTDFELIIVDDGSTDRTSSIVLKYQFDDIRIQYYKMDKNSG
jgi:glycosyltransferase involved in cell wall biosynthesis